MSRVVVQSVNIGVAKAMTIDDRTVQSAFSKRAVDGRVQVGPLGLEGDEQADPTVHGGRSKAVYAYPREHYAFWQTVRAQARVAGWDQTLPAGAVGENLTISGLLEDGAWIGDILRFADCELAISEPRLPCFKFNAAMGFAQASTLMSSSGWCGFYLAVRAPGSLQAGECAELIPGPREVGIAELFRSRANGGRR